MYEIDNQKFGAFLSKLRKEHGMTQKDLAERLFVSDKAVSKWERGLSLPDITLLQPMADTLGVTVTELLAGETIREDQPLNISDVEPIVRGSLELNAQEQAEQREGRLRWQRIFVTAGLCGAAELAVAFLVLKTPFAETTLLLLLLLMFMALIFGVHFVFFAKERLPAYYDENKISFYSSGAFRMNLAGLHFNNSNWPYILKAIRIWCVGVLALWPILCWALQRVLTQVLPDQASTVFLPVSLMTVILGGLIVPVYVVGKKHE